MDEECSLVHGEFMLVKASALHPLVKTPTSFVDLEFF
jgi:hypothetical protein